MPQDDPQVVPPPKQQKKLPEAPSKLPKVGADRTRGLDFLFGALKAAPDEASAKHVEARIWALWMQTPSDTAALLMMRAKAAMDAQQMDVALKLLDAVVKLRPDYVEAWNRRATLYYLKNDYAHSLEDIRAGAGPRTPPFRRAGRAWHDHAGPRRRKARARRLPQGARRQPAPRKGAGTGQDPDRKGRRPRYLIACRIRDRDAASDGLLAFRSIRQSRQKQSAASMQRSRCLVHELLPRAIPSGHRRVELRQFRLQLLVDQQQRLQRAADVAIATRHDLVDGGFAWSEIIGTPPIVTLEQICGPSPAFLWILGTGAGVATPRSGARHMAKVSAQLYKVADDVPYDPAIHRSGRAVDNSVIGVRNPRRLEAVSRWCTRSSGHFQWWQ